MKFRANKSYKRSKIEWNGELICPSKIKKGYLTYGKEANSFDKGKDNNYL